MINVRIPTFLFWIGGAVIVVGLFLATLMGVQKVRVYISEYSVQVEQLRGEAELRRAEQNRMILVEQARAERESASLRAEAIEIIGEAAKKFPEYREQEFLGAFAEALQSESVQKIVFIPTEASIPITEAGRTVENRRSDNGT